MTKGGFSRCHRDGRLWPGQRLATASVRRMHRARPYQPTAIASFAIALTTIRKTPQAALQGGGSRSTDRVPRWYVALINASLLTRPRCPAWGRAGRPGRAPGQGSRAGTSCRRGSGISVLTLHPVPAHGTEEVGVEAKRLIDLPEDLSDVPDLPRDGHQAHLHFPEGAGSLPARQQGPRRKPTRSRLHPRAGGMALTSVSTRGPAGHGHGGA